MGFWGIEVKPGKKVSPFGAADVLGKLRITQATLGQGSSIEKSTVLCLRDQKSPIFLCTLLPDKIESFSLDIELDEDDSVIFSVVGGRSVHLAGYFMEEDEGEDGYGIDDLGEDMAGMGSEESSDYDSEDAFEDDLSDDDTFSDDDRFKTVPNSGVVIEEIVDDDKGNSQSKQPKKTKRSETVERQQQGQIVPRTSASAPVLESEDEDGFPTSKAAPGTTSEEAAEEMDNKKTEKFQKKKKRDLRTVEQDDQPDRKKKTKKQKKTDKEGKDDKEAGDSGTAMAVEDQEKANEVITGGADQVLSQEPQNDNNETQSEKKKKKKKKKKKSEETQDQPATTKSESSVSALSEEKPSQVRTFPNGLVVEELAMGKPDGKRANPGKQVSVHYIGKLQKNGKIFDSNVGRAPFKFRLGIGQVIKGWDVGVKGMRVGDKRRLTIPPSMGYGAKGAGGKIPPNSWLMFDVELVDVR